MRGKDVKVMFVLPDGKYVARGIRPVWSQVIGQAASQLSEASMVDVKEAVARAIANEIDADFVRGVLDDFDLQYAVDETPPIPEEDRIDFGPVIIGDKTVMLKL